LTQGQPARPGSACAVSALALCLYPPQRLSQPRRDLPGFVLASHTAGIPAASQRSHRVETCSEGPRTGLSSISSSRTRSFAVDDRAVDPYCARGQATDAAPPAGSVEAWIAATLALSDHADCPARLLAALNGQHPGRDPSDPPHADRAAQCAVLTALINQWSRWRLTSAKSTQ
jgi:hypothetical protein